jgi:O-antigen/teichoic acid export membrane protein
MQVPEPGSAEKAQSVIGVIGSILRNPRAAIGIHLPRGSLRERIAVGAFWSLLGSAAAQAVGAAGAIATARVLGQVRFGELGLVSSTFGMLGVLAGIGLGTTATKHVAEYRIIDSARAGRLIRLVSMGSIVSGCAVAVAVLALTPILAVKVLGAPELAGSLRLGALLIPLNAVAGVQTGALAGFEAFRGVARVSLWRGLVTVPLSVGGAWLFGVEGAVSGLVLSAAFGAAIGHVALRSECRRFGVVPSFDALGREFRTLWDFSAPAFIAGAMTGPVGWIASTMLVNSSAGYAEMGVFNAANQWRGALLFLPSVFATVNTPVLSSLFATGDMGGARRVVKASILASAAATIPVALALAGASGFVMALYGPGFAGRGGVLALVAAGIALLGVQAPVGQVLVASGRLWIGVGMNVGWAAVLLATNFLLIRRGWGASAIAAAHLVAYSVHALWTFAFAARFLRGGRSALMASTGRPDET